ncbi:hypothetical protein HAX54_027802 [Datura stramonium]|uniref:Uncharacterized protein n=1 Tax=Datura stramonium TaxID=4076 RepID=A0ABS8V5Z3_DATST|nr:hypothetical protein [Datura stramonium]
MEASGYYIIDGDEGIRALQCLICYEFKTIDLSIVDEIDLTIHTNNILHHLKIYHVDVEIASDNEHILRDYDFDIDASFDLEYDKEGLEVISNQRRKVVTDKLENFTELHKGMTFCDIVEVRRSMNYYALANGYGLRIEKTSPSRARSLDLKDEARSDIYFGLAKAYGPEIGDNEDPSLRPRVISEELTLLIMRQTRMRLPTDSRSIQFTGDSIEVSTPTNLTYSPIKVT